MEVESPIDTYEKNALSQLWLLASCVHCFLRTGFLWQPGNSSSPCCRIAAAFAAGTRIPARLLPCRALVVCDGMEEQQGRDCQPSGGRDLSESSRLNGSSSTRVQVRVQAAVQAATGRSCARRRRIRTFQEWEPLWWACCILQQAWEEEDATPHRENGKRSGTSVAGSRGGQPLLSMARQGAGADDRGSLPGGRAGSGRPDHTCPGDGVSDAQFDYAGRPVPMEQSSRRSETAGREQAICYLLASDGLTRDLTGRRRLPPSFAGVPERRFHRSCALLRLSGAGGRRQRKGGGDNITGPPGRSQRLPDPPRTVSVELPHCGSHPNVPLYE